MLKGGIFIALIVGLFISLGVIVGAYLYRNSKPDINIVNTTSTVAGNLPNELAKSFDPTVDSPVFKVVSMDVARKSLRLKMVFPQGFMQEEITSMVACEEGDIKIMKGKEVIGTGSGVLFNTVGEYAKVTEMFMGLCGDTACTNISRQCLFYVM